MSSIRAQVEELGSWITGFEFEGTRYGGDYFPNDDSRVLRFVNAFRQWLRELPDRRRALRILECGCLEGGHTALLAKAFPEAEIVATCTTSAGCRMISARRIPCFARSTTPSFVSGCSTICAIPRIFSSEQRS